MTEETQDDKQEDLDTSSDASADENQDSSDGAGSDTNADEEEVKLTKEDWESMQGELASVKKALAIEREKKRKPLSHVEEKEVAVKEDDKSLSIPKWRLEEIRQERLNYEDKEKDRILKRFPAIAADNEYGINDEVRENYISLIEISRQQGYAPRTREDVAQFLERAVKMTRPDLYIAELKAKEAGGGDYAGTEHGMAYENQDKEVKPMSPADRAFAEHVDSILKK